MSLQTGRDIFRYSLGLVRQHPRLLLFPLLVIAISLLMLALLLQPAFHVPVAEVWNGLWHRGEGSEAMSALAAAVRDPAQLPWLWLATGWVVGMFVVTFVNAAFYSQVISVMNGGSVSVRLGFAAAAARLPAIGPWALLVSTVGLVARTIDKASALIALVLDLILDVIGVSLLMRRLTVLPSVLFGVPWSAAAELVVPVILKEPQIRRPLDYLKISAEMVRRVWGDALVIGILGPTVIGFLLAYGVFTVFSVAASATHQDSLLVWGALLGFAMVCLADAVNGIFRCGLYVYATEGAVPGHFEEQLFSQVWSVK